MKIAGIPLPPLLMAALSFVPWLVDRFMGPRASAALRLTAELVGTIPGTAGPHEAMDRLRTDEQKHREVMLKLAKKVAWIPL